MLENIMKCIKKVSEIKKIRDIRACVHGNNILLDIIVEAGI
jgi:divalent metal cation (Fe/Co/Zn/Cd) transporter